MGYSAIVDKIKGEAGTFVTLVIEDGQGAKRELKLERRLTTQEVVSTRMLDGQIGYVRIENFDTGADKEFTDKVKNLLEAGAQGLVFDVRNNNGGIDTVMSSILDELLPEGLIISIRDKEGNEKYAPKSDAEEIALPMAVVVNRYSYSAAEFFAAALQEYDKAVVVGEATTGKGYAQSTIPLTDGSGLYLSTNTYFTPSGKSLADVGIQPDVECLLPDDVAADTTGLNPASDKQIAEAIRVVAEKMAAQTGANQPAA